MEESTFRAVTVSLVNTALHVNSRIEFRSEDKMFLLGLGDGIMNVRTRSELVLFVQF